MNQTSLSLSLTLTCENVEKPAIRGVILSCLDLQFSPTKTTSSNDCIPSLQFSFPVKYTFSRLRTILKRQDYGLPNSSELK